MPPAVLPGSKQSVLRPAGLVRNAPELDFPRA
jgi:hypothetical protein